MIRLKITDTTIDTVPASAWLTMLAGRLVSQLRAAGIADPLAEPLMLACVLADLFELADVSIPAEVRARIGGELVLSCERRAEREE